jgi:ring-1,2-phenylacetyl-CoA epoxidase subunit PaaD
MVASTMNNITKEDVYKLLEWVVDPEIPVLTVFDLGIIRDVNILETGVEVVITPTYSGCPAMFMIEAQIKAALIEGGIRDVTIRTVLSPAWTTDWITEEGRAKLEKFGIAAPRERDHNPSCPRCASSNTTLLSQFGSTACKALWQCLDCKEPFDYFKCH